MDSGADILQNKHANMGRESSCDFINNPAASACVSYPAISPSFNSSQTFSYVVASLRIAELY